MPEIINPNLQPMSHDSGGRGSRELRFLLVLMLLTIPFIFSFEYFRSNTTDQINTHSHAVIVQQDGLNEQEARKATVAQSAPTAKAPTEAEGAMLKPKAERTWISIIANPLYQFLRFLHGYLGPGAYNWGWAIIIVTLLINMCLLPARLAMVKSSLKMMRIQPKVETIKKRYAHLKINDPKKTEMQTEMMALYKSEGVNMYGSCLPMLIQMPILYAIYRVLANAAELHQAGWFWITDLAAPDPLHILPIFIIATMSVTQLITAQPTMDPTQRRMMAFILPVVMGFMMWHLPAGLSLYWGTGNAIGLCIQLAINQSKAGKEMRAIAGNALL